MTNIKEYFDTLYINAANDEEWDKVNEYEHLVYNMSDEDFFKWAKKIILTLMQNPRMQKKPS